MAISQLQVYAEHVDSCIEPRTIHAWPASPWAADPPPAYRSQRRLPNPDSKGKVVVHKAAELFLVVGSDRNSARCGTSRCTLDVSTGPTASLAAVSAGQVPVLTVAGLTVLQEAWCTALVAHRTFSSEELCQHVTLECPVLRTVIT